VAGIGTVEPVSEASGNGTSAIGSPQPGIVSRVFVQSGQRVKAGAVLFELDGRQLRAELEVRTAALASAAAQLRKLENFPRPEEVPACEAQVHKAQASLALEQDRRDRNRKLAKNKAVTEQDLVSTEQAHLVAKAELAAARAKLDLLKAGTWEPDLAIAAAGVKLAQAQLEQVRTQLELLAVRAPQDGSVLQVNVRPGEHVGTQPGQALVLMGDLESLYLRVSIDEEELPRLRPTAPARARIRSDPRRQEIPLHFVRLEPTIVPKLSLTGLNTERVDTRVGQVIYRIDEQARREGNVLMIGQVLDVFIDGQ
jgi:multidrug resistance efflux pump